MSKASAVSLGTKHTAQADTAASTNYRKGTPRSVIGLSGTGTMTKPLLGGPLKLMSYKAAPQDTSSHTSFKKSPCLIHYKTQLPVLKIKCGYKLLHNWDLTRCSYTTEIEWKHKPLLPESKTKAQRANTLHK